MVMLRCVSAEGSDERLMAEELASGLDVTENGLPLVAFVYNSVSVDTERLRSELAARLPGVAIHGGTSARGVMTQDGCIGRDAPGAGLLALWDPDGAVGTVLLDKADNMHAVGVAGVEAAIEAAGRPFQLPDLVWVSGAPGAEEALIAGVDEVLGGQVPVVGGSTGDDVLDGAWKQFDRKRTTSDGVVITALFSSGGVSPAFGTGHLPTDRTAIATRVDGRRLYELDGRRALDVYNEWTGGQLDPVPDDVLAATSLYPLALEAGEVDGLPIYVLAHPGGVEPDGSIQLFRQIPRGERVRLLEGHRSSLLRRAGRVADSALAAGGFDDGVAGALVVYCAGCMNAVAEDIRMVGETLNRTLGGVPFLCIFTLGEHGRTGCGVNEHGNLMISATLFGS